MSGIDRGKSKVAAETLAAMARTLPKAQPTTEASSRMRAAVLAKARPEDQLEPLDSSRFRLLPAAAAAAAMVAFVVLVAYALFAPSKAESSYRATIENTGGAELIHEVRATEGAGAGPVHDEIVRLGKGRISIDVRPLASRERFRVLVGSTEIEVRGTSFEVIADDERLVDVEVRTGFVEVREMGAPVIPILAGQRWSAVRKLEPERIEPARITKRPAEEDAPVVERRAQAPAADVSTADGPRAKSDATQQRAAADSAFARGWDRMAAGDHPAAADAFAIAGRNPKSAFAEDARFWEAVSLIRADRGSDAAPKMKSFLDRYPSSSRHGEAAAMLGWLFLDQGQSAEAKALFERALEDSMPEARASARAGLEALRSGKRAVPK